MKKKTPILEKVHNPLISRKLAIQKAGKYTAFTAATMMLLMSPSANAATNNSPNQSAPHHPKRH